jgi:hypothetical protein
MSFALEAIAGYDALAGAQLFTPIGFSGSYGGGGATDDSRMDNSLRYRVKVGPVNFGYLHKFGGVTGSNNAQSGNEFQVGYEAGAFGAQVIYQGENDATSVGNAAATTEPVTGGTGTVAVSNANTVKATFYNTQAWMFLVRYKVNKLGLFAGYERESFTNPSDPTNDLACTSIYGQSVSAVSVTPYTVNGASVNKVLKVYWLGARYDWTEKFNTAIAYYEVDQNNFANGGTVAAFPTDQSGSTKYWSGLVDYGFTKAFDIYGGYMATTASAGMRLVAPSLATNSVFGLGARYRF